MINAVIPHPGQSFVEGSRGERVWDNVITRFMARHAIGMNEVCPLTELPQVEYVENLPKCWQSW